MHAQLLALNPHWDADYPAPASARSLERRIEFSSYFCRGRWGEAGWYTIAQGSGYLRRLGGRPGNGAGPGNCGRVSCSYGSAIYWCNDVRATFPLSTTFTRV